MCIKLQHIYIEGKWPKLYKCEFVCAHEHCTCLGRCPRLKAIKQNFSSSKPRNGSPLDLYILQKKNKYKKREPSG